MRPFKPRHAWSIRLVEGPKGRERARDVHRLPLSNAPVPVAVGRYCEHQVSGVICMYCVSSHDVATIAISVHDLQPFFDSVKQCLEAHAHQTHSLNRLLPSAGDTAGGSSAGALCAVLPANTTDLNAVVARMLPGSDLSCERQVRYGDKPCLFRTARAGVHFYCTPVAGPRCRRRQSHCDVSA